jgi:hypothetical protein
MGGSAVKSATNDQKAITQTQIGTGTKELAASDARLSQGDQLQQPQIDFLKTLLSGDKTATNQALSVPLGQIASQTQQTREQLMSGTPAGAARDVALAGLQRQEGAQVAGLENNAFLSAFPGLAGMASQQYGLGTQELGAGITSTGNASTSNQSVLDAAAQGKSGTMGALGSLAGVAGSFLNGSGFATLIGGKK